MRLNKLMEGGLSRAQAVKKIKSEGRSKALPRNNLLTHLLFVYDELRMANPNGISVQPISFSEIRNYNDLMGAGLDPFDVETLRRLDGLWLQSLPKPSSSS